VILRRSGFLLKIQDEKKYINNIRALGNFLKHPNSIYSG
jgi:hypothetical protein